MSLEAGRIFDSAARLLAETLGEASGDVSLGEALSAAAESASGDRADLIQLAAAFARLRALDPDLAALAADTVERFAVIASRRQPW
jgi:hypothetical protein